MSKEQLLRLLAEDEIDQVFHVLRENALSEIVLLEGQWHSLKSDSRAGVLTQEQANVEEARIRRRLLEFIEAGDRPATAAMRQAPAGMGTYRIVFIGLGLLAVFLLGLFLLKPWSPETAEAKTEDAAETPAGETTAGTTTTAKKLKVPPGPVELTAAIVGTTGYQILEAVLSDKNPGNYTLTVRLRCIRPPYGQGISASTLHLVHGQDEIAPFAVEFPFVEPNTTGAGNLKFEVPKTWKDAVLVIYHGAVAPISKAEIPLSF